MRLHVEDSGPGPAKTIVFLHGFPFNHTMWEAQATWAKSYLRVITYDHRGHGQSEVGTGQYPFELFIDDLFNLLDAKKIDQAILCGLSMGGYVALRAIERSPDRFNGLILCDTRSEADSNEAKLKRADAVKTILIKGIPVFCEGFLKSALHPDTWNSNASVVYAVRKMIENTKPAGMVGTVIAMAGRTDTTESLSRIHVPTLIMVGENDPITPPSAAEAMHKKIDGSQLAVIPKAAHLSNLENPTVFNQHFQDFLKRII